MVYLKQKHLNLEKIVNSDCLLPLISNVSLFCICALFHLHLHLLVTFLWTLGATDEESRQVIIYFRWILIGAILFFSIINILITLCALYGSLFHLSDKYKNLPNCLVSLRIQLKLGFSSCQFSSWSFTQPCSPLHFLPLPAFPLAMTHGIYTFL